MDIMEQRLQIVRRNQEIIHNQWDEPLLEFLDAPVYPPDPYASLTPAELANFGIGPWKTKWSVPWFDCDESLT
jgi:hypothetical protein